MPFTACHPRTSLRPLTAVLFLAASPAFAGWSMTQVSTTTGGGQGPPASTQKMWLEGPAARVEIAATGNPMLAAGSYLLALDGGERIFMVNPGERSYARVDVVAMGSAMDAMQGSGLEMRIEDPTVVKVLEEPGGEILGHPTTHYRFRTTYTQVMSMPVGGKSATATEVIEDLWVATTIENGGAAQAMAGMNGGGGGEELLRLASQAKAAVVGLPLKQVTVTTTSSKAQGSGMMARVMRRASGAADGTVTTTMEVRDLVEVAFPAATFEIPAGFVETELMQRGPAMPDLGGSGR